MKPRDGRECDKCPREGVVVIFHYDGEMCLCSRCRKAWWPDE